MEKQLSPEWFEETDNEPETWYDEENDKWYWVSDGHFFECNPEIEQPTKREIDEI